MDKYSVLSDYFGHPEFRAGQEPLVDALIAGRDCLGIMPTGAGKSICYQVPAMVRDGTAIVISPLISLMKDQVAALKAAGIPAAYLNSTLTPSQLELATERAAQGAYRLIYAAPERLDSPSFLNLCRRMKISLLAVDEAHCVSQWGQDFRPEYLRIADFAASLPERPVIGAFTATATDQVRDDITRYLKLDRPVTVTTGFDRPNLRFEVLRPENRIAALCEILHSRENECGIVYCSTRKTVEEVCRKLKSLGYSAARYHAGLSDEERHRSQEDFQFDRVQIMVATNAFGMGIDKSNVSWIVHYNLPKSMEAYYQEAGRAGRDGSPALCVLFYAPQDIFTARYMIEHGAGNPDLPPARRAALRQLEKQRLEEMIRYASQSGCLRKKILNYFGEDAPQTCGCCSGCTPSHYQFTEMIGKKASPQRAASPSFAAQDDDLPPGGTDVFPAFDEYDIPPDDGFEYFPGFAPEYLAPKKKRAPKSAPARKSDAKRADGSLSDARQEEVFEKLRRVRMELAKAEHIAPFIVCSDKTLRDMAAKNPATPEEMRHVNGIGEAKLRKYGPAFLDALRSGDASAPGRAWSGDEDLRLRQAYFKGCTHRQLSLLLARPEEEIADRLRTLHLTV